ncbi:DUF368 domain-containing protein [Halomarina pelagica]|uniref:DUF368 domain-containing protein n=1 Tax=Halomarina pelagica TaxID=2961599 RepID=UPI0020C22E7F|nr:DUF368 domain-containing protein [Halomarina sp. BND7]
MGLRDWAEIYLKGAFMGAADTVPGVSGGTIALITGIYERLITAITNLDPRALALVPGVVTADGRARLRDRLVEMDVPFLLVLGAGIVTAVVTLSKALETALEVYPAEMNAFFFGLILASAIVLYRHVSVDTARRLLVAVAGFVFAFLLTDPSVNGALPSTPPVLFFSGMVAITAMILPGISGSFILYILGQYGTLIGVPSALVAGIVAFARTGDVAPLAGPASTVAVFGVGAVVGLFTIAHVIKYALAHYRAATLTFLVSLMVGALRLPVANVASETGALTAATAAALLAAALVGVALVLGIDHYTDDLEYGSEDEGRSEAGTATDESPARAVDGGRE